MWGFKYFPSAKKTAKACFLKQFLVFECSYPWWQRQGRLFDPKQSVLLQVPLWDSFEDFFWLNSLAPWLAIFKEKKKWNHFNKCYPSFSLLADIIFRNRGQNNMESWFYCLVHQAIKITLKRNFYSMVIFMEIIVIHWGCWQKCKWITAWQGMKLSEAKCPPSHL